MENSLEMELLWVYNNFDFSPECTDELKNQMLAQGFVEDIEGSYVVTDLGESLIGMSIEEDESKPYDKLEEVDVYEFE